MLREERGILTYSDEKKLNIDTIELLKVTSTNAGVDWIELQWVYENENVDFYQISCSHNGITVDYRIEGWYLSGLSAQKELEIALKPLNDPQRSP